MINYEAVKPDEPESLRFIELFVFTIYFQTALIRYTDEIKPHVFISHIMSEDNELFLRLIFGHNYKVGKVNKFLAQYRRHKTSIRDAG